MVVDKHSLVRALVSALQDEVARATQAADSTRKGAVHEESRPENDKDTRALEASYLARGQAQRVVDLESACKRVAFMPVRAFGKDDAIDLGALVQLESEDDAGQVGQAEASRWYLLVPAAGGRRLQLTDAAPDGRTLQVDTLAPDAPLGLALVGRLRGESVELRAGGRLRELYIAQVC